MHDILVWCHWKTIQTGRVWKNSISPWNSFYHLMLILCFWSQRNIIFETVNFINILGKIGLPWALVKQNGFSSLMSFMCTSCIRTQHDFFAVQVTIPKIKTEWIYIREIIMWQKISQWDEKIIYISNKI